eukprot:1199019-Amphidinium_carterae.1
MWQQRPGSRTGLPKDPRVLGESGVERPATAAPPGFEEMAWMLRDHGIIQWMRPVRAATRVLARGSWTRLPRWSSAKLGGRPPAAPNCALAAIGGHVAEFVLPAPRSW